jgi:hypothetical protein
VNQWTEGFLLAALVIVCAVFLVDMIFTFFPDEGSDDDNNLIY